MSYSTENTRRPRPSLRECKIWFCSTSKSRNQGPKAHETRFFGVYTKWKPPYLPRPSCSERAGVSRDDFYKRGNKLGRLCQTRKKIPHQKKPQRPPSPRAMQNLKKLALKPKNSKKSFCIF